MDQTVKGVYQDVVDALQHPHREVRIQAAQAVGKLIEEGKITRQGTEQVNNHVHTAYSFSPYEPAMAAFKAWQAGLQIVGSIDHDSIASADEMRRAASGIGIASTVGFELRTSFRDTLLSDRKINSPDGTGTAYVVVHGVPGHQIDACSAFLKPVQKARNRRNRKQTTQLNTLLKSTDLGALNFSRDVMSISHADEGGSITERHILSALAQRIIDRTGKGEGIIRRLKEDFSITAAGQVLHYLRDPANPHYLYDLLGVLKAHLLPKFYIQPDESETLPVAEVVKFASSIGAVAAYPYLGDVTESPTGDKKAEQFEDSFLEELFEVLAELGFPAVTYMPPRNTREQLLRVQDLAHRYGLMEISGVDINSSRQSFNCPELLDQDFIHLIDSAWALTAHEKLSEVRESWGLFAHDNPLSGCTLQEKIFRYSSIGRRMDRRFPHRAEEYIGEDLSL